MAPRDHLDPALILTAEAATARIEGLLSADPCLARHWRTEMAWSEAAASVGLEDIRVTEAVILMRLTAQAGIDDDVRGAEMAGRLLRVMADPVDLLGDPVAAVRRIEAAASPLGVAARSEVEDAEIEAIAAEARRWVMAPVLGAVRAAAAYAHCSARWSPAAERLLFVVVESELRRLSRNEARPNGHGAEQEAGSGLIRAADASWTVAPAAALSHGGFRLWAPISGAPILLDAVAGQARRELGQLGRLRHDLERLRLASAGRGRSRLGDLADMVRGQPILTSGMVVERLGVTRKTALALIAALEGQGCLVNITARKAARFWATPSLSERLRQPARRAASRSRPIEPVATSAPLEGGLSRLPRQDAGGLEAAYAKLDEALREVSGLTVAKGRA